MRSQTNSHEGAKADSSDGGHETRGAERSSSAKPKLRVSRVDRRPGGGLSTAASRGTLHTAQGTASTRGAASPRPTTMPLKHAWRRNPLRDAVAQADERSEIATISAEPPPPPPPPPPLPRMQPPPPPPPPQRRYPISLQQRIYSTTSRSARAELSPRQAAVGA